MDTEDFIAKAKAIHGDKYDYSKTEYVDSKTKVLIKCNNCGNEFWQSPNGHLDGGGCPKSCRTSQYWDLPSFIAKAREVHGNKYDYSKAEYVKAKIKACIICPKHGEFWQTPDSHTRGGGCPQCAHERAQERFVLPRDKFIDRCNKIHKNKYDYSKVEFKNLHENITIICPVHGEYQQEANHHMRGIGCPKCSHKVYDLESFVAEARKAHGDKYDYSESEYKGIDKKVKIICPVHGEFWQLPGHHVRGVGCPTCKASRGEKYIQKLLTENNVPFITQARFDGLTGKGGKPLAFDIRLKNANILIEYQGVQHFRPVDVFGGERDFLKNQANDQTKRDWCKENGFKLIEINKDLDTNTFSDKDKEIVKRTLQEAGII